ncbi:Uma2 family endonuclease [Aneurinibacillus soli]|uniref:Uncharacterized protein n=1 Tax=Aneurinibacillus soli TaxID=1500254 RepID=A0A0U4NFD0_9BACL|nr:Uma2 family endonuclease [Aneurinibacillus soli]PYE63543.1 Uma2 family endonuclease [Aneurinibacillus soli]BAU27524.1 hypothetical protein CB4_01698 [Aneurinibacillus soli]
MSVPERDLKRTYTYQDYLGWSDDERFELIDGVPYAMSPAPSRKHQQVSGGLFGEFWSYLRDKSCQVYAAPFDVRLGVENETDDKEINVVQPDITVVCDKNKLDDKGCKGAPNLIVEILSPSTGKRDRWLKYKLYERAGVQEYWIVEPQNETIEVYRLLNEQYVLSGVYGKEDKVEVGIFEDMTIDLDLVFRE